jgi:arylsulfatase A-like enzyme
MLTALWAQLAQATDRPNVVWISLDTTRADALSCYGVPVGPYRVPTQTTPHLDALAQEGVRFENFYAHAPSTLSSHASMFTGLDPHGHAVVRNGFPLDPALPTLPERLAGAGWDTVAVLGSAALERSMGLDRGFRVYDDTMTNLSGIMFQRSAEEVVQSTFTVLDSRPDPAAPLFLFAHFYDPHAPYQPPEPFRSRFTDPAYTGSVDPLDVPSFRQFTQQVRRQQADPADISHVSNLYLGEVAYMDEQVGRLLAGLQQRGLLEHALVIVVADHGETLADDFLYAWSHGSNVGWEVMRVPLLVRGYGMPLAERAVLSRQAGMDGLASTVLELVGLSAEGVGEGLSFASWLRAGPVRDVEGWPEHPTIPVYVEATRPRIAEQPGAWNNLYMHRGVWASGWGLVTAPFLEHPPRFYDTGVAPNEGVRELLTAMLTRWDAGAPAPAAPRDAPSTTKALKALGYVE